ncbi:MAG TPA: TonB-dependent receptor [Bryobacterales bacterium]|nr:TonB-dependent receptor [Bryobacterales bacterium]
MKRLKFVAIVALLVYAGIRPAAAQNSTIQGIVTDQSSAVVPGVQVTVTNAATGVANALQTNESGFYSVPLLDAGTYRVEASKQGFAPVKRDSLKLDVGQTARVDFTLKVGAVAETVEVTAALAPIDSQTSTVGQVINNQQIAELPLNGRNYLQLARLTAAVAPSNGSRTDAKGSFSALGQHGLQTNIMLDGVDNNSRFSGGQLGFEAQGVTPSIDAVQEFKVVTNNNSAEYGFRMGGTVIVSTKSGTNEFHGSAYEFFRNDKLDGANFFAVGQPKPAFHRNQFGATVGGPVIKNRTFFFASYEGTRIRQGSSSISTLPTVAMRNGDFSATRPIFDPMTTRQDAAGKYVRDLFAGNQIPASRFDPVSQKVIALYPIPSLPGIVNNNFFSGSHKDDTDEIDTRVDHNLSDKHRIFGRYSRRQENSLDPGPLPLPADGGLWTTTDVIAHSVVANLNSTLTPTLNNEVRFGFNKIDSLLDIPWTTGLDSQLGIKGVPDLGSITSRGMARFSPTGYTEVGARSFWPNPNNLHVLQLSDQLLQVHGRHMLKMGFAFTRELIYRNSSRLARGQFSFDGSFTQDPNNRGKTGDGMADFLLGIASGGTIGNRNGETAVTHNYSAFFQDDWRITNRLTLNLGVRWDEFGPPTFPDSVVSRLEIFPGPNFNQFSIPRTTAIAVARTSCETSRPASASPFS